MAQWIVFFEKEKGENDNNKSNSEKEIIVLCKPELPQNVSIDDDNNIHIEYILHIDTIKEKLINNTSFFVDIQIGNKLLQMPLENLYIKKEQIYVFKREGIAQIIEDDMYNISCKSDIIVKIILVAD